jgi:glycerophosphoryl diester phosphodiesterase
VSPGVRVERRRRALRRVGLVAAATVAAVALGYAVLWSAARWFVEVRDPAPFFAADGDRPLVVAHQGGELLAPSNTMAAFDRAVALGVDVVDSDVHLSADGALVLVHDDTVDRTSDGTGAVAEMTLDELRGLDFGHRFTEDGLTFPYRGRGHGIVTVDELFRAHGDRARFGLEIKPSGAEAAVELCATIRRFGYEDRVLVSSFGQSAMDAFREACPQVATSATESEVRMFYYLHRVGLNGLLEPAYEALQVPERSAGRLVVSQGFVDDAAEWGLPIVPWTIDEPIDMERLLDLGVAGLNTNRPDLLVDLVADRLDRAG